MGIMKLLFNFFVINIVFVFIGKVYLFMVGLGKIVIFDFIIMI